MTLFSLGSLHTANCRSSCHGVERENVTWCVRFAYVSGYLETCLSLGEDDQPVFQSTCDTSALNLEDHLSLPTVSYSPYNACLFVDAPLQREKCGQSGGCLGLANLNWFFIGAYLTCIAETDTCRDVNFVRILAISTFSFVSINNNYKMFNTTRSSSSATKYI